MRVARKKPHLPWEFAEIENTLEALQAEVGGYIETLTITPDTVLVMDEEGILSDKLFNFRWGAHQFFGTVLLCGVDGDEFTDCPITDLSILPGHY